MFHMLLREENMATQWTRSIGHRSVLNFAGACLATVLSVALGACSGGSSSSNTGTTTPPAAKTPVQVSMGDAPSDWMLAFTMNISSMSLTGSNGSVSVISSPMPMEMMHLMGTMQPIAMISVPQGTYTGASISISSVTVMYMDPVSLTPVQATIPGPINGNVTFSSVTVGSTPMAIGFDLNLANSVTMGSSGALAMNPVFQVTSGMQGSGNPLDPSDGGIQEMMGVVSNVSGSTFSMSTIQAAQNFTFSTNSSTVFDGTSMSSMGNGMIVIVDASLQSDGSLMATTVQSMMGSGGMMGGGIITALTGQPATSLTMVMQNGVGTGMMSSMFASGAAVNLSGVSSYDIDDDNVDMTGLPFVPAFGSSNIYAGQSVMPVSSTGMMSGTGGGMMGGASMTGTIYATKVELEPQGLSGTIATTLTSGVQNSFTLTLPTTCAFATLTGANTVTVYQQAKTVISTGSSIASGSTVHVNGLLFKDNGQWKMVAARMGSN